MQPLCPGGEGALRPAPTSKAASGDYTAPGDGCISYRTLCGAVEEFEADLHRHIHLENNVLFPRAAGLEQETRAGR